MRSPLALLAISGVALYAAALSAVETPAPSPSTSLDSPTPTPTPSPSPSVAVMPDFVVDAIDHGQSTAVDGDATGPWIPSQVTVGALEPKDFGELFQVTDRCAFPYSCVTRIRGEWPLSGGGTAPFVGSGVMVGPKHVLTAGHVVIPRDVFLVGYFGTEPLTCEVIPAWDGTRSSALDCTSHEPYGSAKAEKYFVFSQWSQSGNRSYDIALIELDRPLGAVTGWVGYGYNTDCTFFTTNTFHAPGYPAESPYSGELMYDWAGTVDRCSALADAYNINRIGYGGQSGSGLIRSATNIAYGVHRGRNVEGTLFTKVTPTIFDAFRAFVADSAEERLVPVDVRVRPHESQGLLHDGQKLDSLDFAVHNDSVSAYSGTATATFYLSRTEDFGIGVVPMGSPCQIQLSLPANGASRVSVPQASLPSVPVGVSTRLPYYLLVTLDTGNRVGYSHGDYASRVYVDSQATPVASPTVTPSLSPSPAATPSPTYSGHGPDIRVYQPVIDFGNVNVGESKLLGYPDVTNEGDQDLTFTQISGVPTNEFRVISYGFGVTQPPFIFSPGATRNWTIEFAPKTAGQKEITVSIYTNDPDESPFLLKLQGYGGPLPSETPTPSPTPSPSPSPSYTPTASPSPEASPFFTPSPVPDDAYEENDDYDAAKPIANDQLVSSLILLDDDWYIITVPDKTHLKIVADFQHSLGDLQLQLYDARTKEGDDYGGFRVGEAYGASDQEAIEYVNLTNPGRLFLRVYGEGGSQNPSYSLQITTYAQDDAFDLPPYSNDWPGAGHVVPSLSLGTECSDLICRDDDYYRLPVAGVGAIHIAVTHHNPSGDLNFQVSTNPDDPFGSLIGSGYNPNVDVEQGDVPIPNGVQAVYIRIYGEKRQSNFYSLEVTSVP